MKTGLVASLNRPDGNLTGVTFLLSVIAAKQFEVLQEAVPKPGTIGFLVNPTLPEAEAAVPEVRAAAQALGHELLVANASSEREIDAAFAMLAQRRIGALFVGNDVFFYSRREQIVALAARHAIPAIYVVREYAQAGGLMSYGTDVNDAQRLAGVYVGRLIASLAEASRPTCRHLRHQITNACSDH